MQFRRMIELEVAKASNEVITDELFREAAAEADKDIKFHKLMFGRKTSLSYVVFVMSTTILILINHTKLNASHIRSGQND